MLAAAADVTGIMAHTQANVLGKGWVALHDGADNTRGHVKHRLSLRHICLHETHVQRQLGQMSCDGHASTHHVAVAAVLVLASECVQQRKEQRHRTGLVRLVVRMQRIQHLHGMNELIEAGIGGWISVISVAHRA